LVGHNVWAERVVRVFIIASGVHKIGTYGAHV
jgi:hypothetical protein